VRKRKRTTAEEWAHVQARLARLEARERELRELVEAGAAELHRRTVEERPSTAASSLPSGLGLHSSTS
jgi:hypothetical protein